MYTAYPLEMPSNVPIILAAIVAFTLIYLMLYSLRCAILSTDIKLKGVMVYLVCVSAMVLSMWFFMPKPVEPANTPVEVTLMDEEYIASVKDGKRTKDYQFVMYMTPEGPVSFRRETGKVYPKRAILYRN